MTESIQLLVTDRDGQRHQLAAPIGAVLMEVLRDAGLGVEAVCGGCCACATCQVYVNALPGSAPDAMEVALLASTDAYQSQRSRLSCQIELGPELDKLQLEIAPED